jgi:hypothetical protein
MRDGFREEFMWSSFKFAAAIELADRRNSMPDLGPDEEGEGEELEINAAYQRKLLGLKHLPRAERAAARRNARQWRKAALNALHEKRAGARHARHRLRQLRMASPS